MACFELCPFCRCSTSPDSLKKSLNFASCCVRRNFIDFLKCCLQQILNSSGLLVNSANVIHKDISFWDIFFPAMCEFIHIKQGRAWDPITRCEPTGVKLSTCVIGSIWTGVNTKMRAAPVSFWASNINVLRLLFFMSWAPAWLKTKKLCDLNCCHKLFRHELFLCFRADSSELTVNQRKETDRGARSTKGRYRCTLLSAPQSL